MILLMRRIYTGIITGLLSSLVFAVPAFAQGGADVKLCPDNSVFKVLCNFQAGSFGNIISAVITLLFIIAVVVALIFLIYGGIKWIVSGGDKTAVESARNHIIAAIVGLVIAFAAYFLLNIVAGIFGIDLKLIKLPVLTP